MTASPPGTAGPSSASRAGVAADQRQPLVDRARVGRRAGGRQPRGAHAGLRGRRHLQRLGRGPEGALHAAGRRHREGHGRGDRVGPEPQRDGRAGRRGRSARRARRVPARRVVRPAQRVAQPRHDPGAGQVGARVAAGRQHRGHAHRADVRGRLHVQVVEVEDVGEHGPRLARRAARRAGRAIGCSRAAIATATVSTSERCASARSSSEGSRPAAQPASCSATRVIRRARAPPRGSRGRSWSGTRRTRARSRPSSATARASPRASRCARGRGSGRP